MCGYHMVARDRTGDIHALDVTVWVGKAGTDAVLDELDAQLDDRELVKVRFHRSAMVEGTTEELVSEMADRTGATVVDVRGHTGVFRR